jgi:hypothetical protein
VSKSTNYFGHVFSKTYLKTTWWMQTMFFTWFHFNQGCQIFKPKMPLWVSLGGLELEMVGIFYCHLEYITTLWHILRPFGNLVSIWYFSPVCKEKCGNPVFNQNLGRLFSLARSLRPTRFSRTERKNLQQLIASGG